jgi:hypothetical protein
MHYYEIHYLIILNLIYFRCWLQSVSLELYTNNFEGTKLKISYISDTRIKKFNTTFDAPVLFYIPYLPIHATYRAHLMNVFLLFDGKYLNSFNFRLLQRWAWRMTYFIYCSEVLDFQDWDLLNGFRVEFWGIHKHNLFQKIYNNIILNFQCSSSKYDFTFRGNIPLRR